MNKSQFYTYLNKPELLNQSSIAELEGILREYPWFQTAHILYLKSLYKTGHLKFNKQLRKSSTYISDRKVLYTFLNSEIPDYQLETDIKQVVEQLAVKPKTEKVNTNPVKKTNKLKKEEKVIVDEVSKQSETKEIGSEDEISTQKNKVLTKSKKVSNNITIDLGSKYSFEEWLRLFSNRDVFDNKKEDVILEKPVEKESKLINRFVEPSQNELVDRFIELNPRLENKLGDKLEYKDISMKSISDDDGFITETLAKIYIKQKHYERAIQAYQKLSLKYPEKNIYFANQIEKIKKLNNE